MQQLLASLLPARLFVLGDLMVDRTRWVRPDRPSGSRSLLLSDQERPTDRPGGAGYVATLLSGLGNEVIVAGVIGDDQEGHQLTRAMTSSGIETQVLVDQSRPTTLKERFVVRRVGQTEPLMRIDRESVARIPQEIEARMRESLTAAIPGIDGIVLSDYAKGVCTPKLVQDVIEMAQQAQIPVVVDPARRTSLSRFAGADVITPNRHEAEAATGIGIETPEDAALAGLRLCASAGVRACIVTLDADGAMVATKNGETRHFPTGLRQVVDATGAGDAFAATLLQAIVCGRTLDESIPLANYVAGHQTEQFGTAPLAREDLTATCPVTRPTDTRSKCVSLGDVNAILEHRRRQGERIVLTNGCFDLLHAGHVDYLERAANEGECLVVAVNADRTVTQLKGNQRPIVPQRERARLLAALACVDFVVVFEEPTPCAIIRSLRPDVLVKGGDYTVEEVVGGEFVESYGGTVKTLGFTPGRSTTQMLSQIAALGLPNSHAG